MHAFLVCHYTTLINKCKYLNTFLLIGLFAMQNALRVGWWWLLTKRGKECSPQAHAPNRIQTSCSLEAYINECRSEVEVKSSPWRVSYLRQEGDLFLSLIGKTISWKMLEPPISSASRLDIYEESKRFHRDRNPIGEKLFTSPCSNFEYKLWQHSISKSSKWRI